MTKKYRLFLIFYIAILLFTGDKQALASSIKSETIPDIKNDFVLSPARIDFTLNPGESVKKYITVTNRFSEDYNFTIDVQDFFPDPKSGEPVLGAPSLTGDYSLKSFVKPEVYSFFLHPGSQITISINVAVPKNFPPGGRYAAVLVSAGKSSQANGSTKIISRLGSLLLLKVNGREDEVGELTGLSFQDNEFSLTFENNGNVHLDPYGVIDIFNINGKKFDRIQIDPWIVLPGSSRTRILKLVSTIPDGEYIAKAFINRGYKDIIDSKEISFKAGTLNVAQAGRGVGDGIINYAIILLFAAVIIFLILVFTLIKIRWLHL